jgi:superfamily II DNA or RNA helicase
VEAPVTLRDCGIGIHYEGSGVSILQEFVLPSLQVAIAYDRVTSFFSVSSLLAIAEGIEDLWRRGGMMRLVLGIHDVPPELAQASQPEYTPDDVIQAVRARLLRQASSIHDELVKDRLAALAWMIQEGLLVARVACPILPRGGVQGGIFHSKSFIFRDESGLIVSAVGSPNETIMGLGSNFEEITVHRSWDDAQGYVSTQVRSFDRLWASDREDLIVRELDASFARDLLKSIGRLPAESPGKALPNPVAQRVLEVVRRSPAWAAMNSGRAVLYPHQERTMLDALSRWPLRVMLADEVGLGKTLEAGALISYATKQLDMKRVVVLAPKNVLRQWQDELALHFDLPFWLYESGSRSFVAPDGSIRGLPGGDNPVGPNAPERVLISAQLARGTRTGGHLFEGLATYPDLLVVDEAHAARVKPDIQGTMRPTRLWRMLDDVRSSIEHLVLVTATPLQIHWREYHALLALLGLPSRWREPDDYERSLSLLAADSGPSNLTNAGFAMSLIHSTAVETGWRPHHLSRDESDLLKLAISSDPSTNARKALAAMQAPQTTFSLLVKMHPAHFLTIRNSRSALESLGYRFPSRNLQAPELDVSDDVRTFYEDVDTYLDSAYGEMEKAADPDRKYNIGFTKSSYHQRLASSLHAAGLSLGNRLRRIASIRDGFIFEVPDEEDDDEEAPARKSSVPRESKGALDRAYTLERSYIDDLLARLERIMNSAVQPDPKFLEALRVLETHLGQDRVLLFSRYTDTLDGMLEALHAHFGHLCPSHAMYTGDQTWIDTGGGPLPASKQSITRALEDGDVQLVFCSEAASEGLNLQGARVLVNIDVPWNPARLEQRIGRIARLGQQASEVEVYNLWYPDSVEAKIYSRLLERRQLYQLAVGEFPELISEAIRSELASRFQHGMRAVADDPFEILQNLRQQHQHLAMQRVWHREVELEPASADMRRRLAELISLCAERGGRRVEKSDSRISLISAGGEWRSFVIEPGTSRSLHLFDELLDELAAAASFGDSATSSQGHLEIVSTESVPLGFIIRRSDERWAVPAQSFPELLGAVVGAAPLSITQFTRVNDVEEATTKLMDETRWSPRRDALRVPSEVQHRELPKNEALRFEEIGRIPIVQ